MNNKINNILFTYFLARETLNCSEISSIAHDKHHNNYVNESLSSTISNFSSIDPVINKLPGGKYLLIYVVSPIQIKSICVFSFV